MEHPSTSHSSIRPARRWAAAVLTAGAVAASLVAATGASAESPIATATLRDVAGTSVGKVRFYNRDGHTTVDVRLNANAHVASRQFHGFHIHTGSDSASATKGCIADAAKPAATWFVSAGGHLHNETEVHANHTGDLESLLVNADGTARSVFTTDRFAPSELAGRAIILHAGADNFGNVPMGAGVDQYTANSPAAVTKTQNTGNAGDRVACGVIRVGRSDD